MWNVASKCRTVLVHKVKGNHNNFCMDYFILLSKTTTFLITQSARSQGNLAPSKGSLCLIKSVWYEMTMVGFKVE